MNLIEFLAGRYMKLTWKKDVSVYYTPIWNVILSLLGSQMDFHSTKIYTIMDIKIDKDYISNMCV